MDCLPLLDIEEDLSNLLEEDTPEDKEVEEITEKISETVIREDLSVPIAKTFDLSPKDIFINKPTNGVLRPKPKTTLSTVEIETPEIETPPQKEENEEEPEPKKWIDKPVRKRKPVSEKQREHLARVRVKAFETKRIRKLERAEAKRVALEEKEKTKLERKAEPKRKKTTPDFAEKMKIPSEEEVLKNRQLEERNHFIDFMTNMKKYESMRFEYDNEQKRISQERLDREKVEREKVERERLEMERLERKKTNSIPMRPPDILKPPENPFASAFDW